MWLQDQLGGNASDDLAWLDLGCGKGQVFYSVEKNIEPAKRARISFVGVDGRVDHAKSAESLALTCRLKSVEVLCTDLNELGGLQGRSFDLITLINTCHELPPQSLGSLLYRAIGMLAPEGKLLAYDMEQLPTNALELGALTWGRHDIQELTAALVAPLNSSAEAVVTGRWNHHSCSAWNMWVNRSALRPTRSLEELREPCLAAAQHVTGQILDRRLRSVRQLLAAVTTRGPETAAEVMDVQRSLYDLWALDRARNGS